MAAITKIDKFVLPSTQQEKRNFLLIGSVMLLLVSTILFPSSFKPYFNSVLLSIVKWVTIPTLGIHFLEYVFVVWPILAQHDSDAIIKAVYFILTFFIGFPSWMPLKRVTSKRD